MADGDPIIFEELTGDNPRTFVLDGPDLPERPVEVGGGTRLVSTWYPGAEEASVQVMGTNEEPIVLRGVLNDRWTFIDGGALSVKNQLEALRMRQRRIRMSWGTEIDVEGFIESLRFNFHRRSLIFYELSFMVALGDQPEAIAVTPFPRASESELVESLNDSINFIDDDTPAIVSALDGIAAVI